MEQMVWNQVKHLYEVEKLSIRQIAQKLRMARKTVGRVFRNERVMRSFPDAILRPPSGRRPGSISITISRWIGIITVSLIN